MKSKKIRSIHLILLTLVKGYLPNHSRYAAKFAIVTTEVENKYKPTEVISYNNVCMFQLLPMTILTVIVLVVLYSAMGEKVLYMQLIGSYR